MIDLAPFAGGERERVLAALVGAGGEPVAHEDLAARAGVGAPRLVALLADLRDAGAPLEEVPHRGHRLALAAPPIDARAIEAAAARTLRWRLAAALPAVTSTNDVALALGEAGEPDGAVVVAEAQTRGRGRHGRPWVSPPGAGLWCSFLLRPPLGASSASDLTPAAALAAARAARAAAGVALRVKWPNDLVADAPLRRAGAPPDTGAGKVGGILCEARTAGERLDFAVIGIGINVAPLPGGAAAGALGGRATSLDALAGRRVLREPLLAALLESLATVLAVVEPHGLAPVLDELRERSSLLGRRVVVALGARRIAGVARDVDASGALLVAADDGRIERILAGEATLAETP